MSPKKLCLYILFFNVNVALSQQLGDGREAFTSSFNGVLLSGFYQNYGNFLGKVPDTSHDWNHLLVLCHSNVNNNHQMQIASSYSENDRLFFRKIAAGNLDPSYGTTWYELATRGTNRFTGRIGIGPSDPLTYLHVSEAATLGDGTLASAIIGSAYNQWLYVGGVRSGRLRGGPGEGYLVVDSYPTGTNNTLYLNAESSGDIRIGLGGGRTFIGTNASISDRSHTLFVNGGVRTTKVTVDVATSWPDYVFSPSYKLMTLPELSAFVGKYRHLPDMPSAEEAERGGVNIGEMNAKLLKKIEELTLYLIEKDNEITLLKGKIEGIESRITNKTEKKR